MRDLCLDFHFCQTRFKVIRINTQVMLRVEKNKENVGKARKLWVFIYLFFVFVFFNIQSYLFFITHTDKLCPGATKTQSKTFTAVIFLQ